MNQGERAELTRIVDRCKAINAQIQDLKWEAKELAEAAWDRCGVKAKVVKQLAKEAAWDEVRREEQRQHEESLDECRAALGLLADLPLGQAAQHSVTNPLHKAPNGAGNGAHASGTNGTGGAVKRGRGRPPGAKNKPRAPQPQPAEAEAPPTPDWPQ